MYSRTRPVGSHIRTRATTAHLDPTFAPGLNQAARRRFIQRTTRDLNTKLALTAVPAAVAAARAWKQPDMPPKQKPKKKLFMPAVQRVQVNQRAPRQQVRFSNAPMVRTQDAPIGRGVVMRRGGSKPVQITHSEHVTRIYQTDQEVSFRDMYLGPSIGEWASKYLELYEHYEIERAVLEYIPASSATAVGTIGIAVDYDPSDPAPTTDSEFLNMRDVASASPWQHFTLPLTTADLKMRSPFYCQVTGASAAEQRQNFVGKVHIMAANNGTTNLAGRLFIHYVLKFSTPQLGSGRAPKALANGGASSWQGTSNALPFGSAPVEGYLPASVASTGTTTSVTTWTFNTPWVGYVDIETEGADLTTPTDASSTATVTNVWSRDNNTYTYRRYYISADYGDTFILSIANTSISGNKCYFTSAAKLATL